MINKILGILGIILVILLFLILIIKYYIGLEIFGLWFWKQYVPAKSGAIDYLFGRVLKVPECLW